jgi:hypothetical protein
MIAIVRIRGAWWVGLIAVATACSEPALQLDDYARAYREAYCQRLVRCGEIADVETCERVTGDLRVDLDWRSAADAGKVVWHAEAAQACVDALASLTCDRATEEYRRPRCLDVFTGTLGDGEVCAFGGECISKECFTGDDMACAEACCLGTCIGETPPTPGGIGDVCRHAPCLEGWCDGNLCVPRLSEGTACSFDDQCDLGLACDYWTDPFAWVCRALPGAGEPCMSPCRELGQVCSSLTRACEPAGQLGASCIARHDCASFYQCDASYRCAEGAAIGEACSRAIPCADPRAHCEYGDGFEGTCAMPKPDGATCATDHECESYSCNGLGACTSDPCI